MAGLFVEEYANLHFQEGSVFPIPSKLIAVTEVTITTETDMAQAFDVRTKFVNLTAEGACHFKLGVHAAITATTGDRFLPAGASRFFAVDNVDAGGTETGLACITA